MFTGGQEACLYMYMYGRNRIVLYVLYIVQYIQYNTNTKPKLLQTVIGQLQQSSTVTTNFKKGYVKFKYGWSEKDYLSPYIFKTIFF